MIFNALDTPLLFPVTRVSLYCYAAWHYYCLKTKLHRRQSFYGVCLQTPETQAESAFFSVLMMCWAFLQDGEKPEPCTWG